VAGERDPGGERPRGRPRAAGPEPAQPGGKVEQKENEKSAVSIDLKFSRAIDKRLPMESGDSFTAGQVHCRNEVRGMKGEGTISHRWYRDGKKIVEIPIGVKSQRWRTWSFVNAMVPGSYRVEVAGEGGEILKSAEFQVAKETRVSVKQATPPTVTR
jgi:hypothetical protein